MLLSYKTKYLDDLVLLSKKLAVAFDFLDNAK